VLVHVIKLNEMGRWGWVISVVFIMAASYRLARYNLMASTEEKGDFVGLPVPAAAIALVGYIIFCHEVWGEVRYSQAIVSQTILYSFLMVSQVSYESVPDRFTSSEARIKLVLMLVVGAALLFKPRLLLFPFCASYILFGILREMYRLLYRGVGRVTGRPQYDRRRTNGKKHDV
jgi:CDP-diacylglycerol--serine O-phosphatidyltransferase